MGQYAIVAWTRLPEFEGPAFGKSYSTPKGY
jgi:hypothetical protein